MRVKNSFSGKTIAITGSLRPVTRQEAISFLQSQGAIVQGYVSAQTDILIAGHKQIDLFDPDKYSKKYEAALKRIEEGQEIKIYSEEQFFRMMKQSQ